MVARIASFGAIWAICEKIEVFRSGISGTASITKSTDDRSSNFRLGVMRDRAAVAASLVMRSLEMSFSSSLSFAIPY